MNWVLKQPILLKSSLEIRPIAQMITAKARWIYLKYNLVGFFFPCLSSQVLGFVHPDESRIILNMWSCESCRTFHSNFSRKSSRCSRDRLWLPICLGMGVVEVGADSCGIIFTILTWKASWYCDIRFNRDLREYSEYMWTWYILLLHRFWQDKWEIFFKYLHSPVSVNQSHPDRRNEGQKAFLRHRNLLIFGCSASEKPSNLPSFDMARKKAPTGFQWFGSLRQVFDIPRFHQDGFANTWWVHRSSG